MLQLVHTILDIFDNKRVGFTSHHRAKSRKWTTEVEFSCECILNFFLIENLENMQLCLLQNHAKKKAYFTCNHPFSSAFLWSFCFSHNKVQENNSCWLLEIFSRTFMYYSSKQDMEDRINLPYQQILSTRTLLRIWWLASVQTPWRFMMSLGPKDFGYPSKW